MKTHAQPAVRWPSVQGQVPSGKPDPSTRCSCGRRVGPGLRRGSVWRSSLVGKCSTIGSRECATEFRCRLPADADNSAAGELGQIVSKLLKLLLFLGAGRAIFGG